MKKPQQPKPEIVMELTGSHVPGQDSSVLSSDGRFFYLIVPESMRDVLLKMIEQQTSLPYRMALRVIIEGYVMDA